MIPLIKRDKLIAKGKTKNNEDADLEAEAIENGSPPIIVWDVMKLN